VVIEAQVIAPSLRFAKANVIRVQREQPAPEPQNLKVDYFPALRSLPLSTLTVTNPHEPDDSTGHKQQLGRGIPPASTQPRRLRSCSWAAITDAARAGTLAASAAL
jgi:hypothetical protein